VDGNDRTSYGPEGRQPGGPDRRRQGRVARV